MKKKKQRGCTCPIRTGVGYKGQRRGTFPQQCSDGYPLSRIVQRDKELIRRNPAIVRQSPDWDFFLLFHRFSIFFHLFHTIFFFFFDTFVLFC